MHVRAIMCRLPDICRGCLFMLLPCSASIIFCDKSSITSRSEFLQVCFATSLDNKSAITVYNRRRRMEVKDRQKRIRYVTFWRKKNYCSCIYSGS